MDLDARIGTLIGDVTGWWFGTSIAERVYDWIFTELEKEEEVKTAIANSIYVMSGGCRHFLGLYK